MALTDEDRAEIARIVAAEMARFQAGSGIEVRSVGVPLTDAGVNADASRIAREREHNQCCNGCD